MKRLLIALFFAQVAWADGGEVLNFKIDPTHASIVFKVDHLGYSPVYGMFGAVDGKFSINEKKIEDSTFEVNVKADSVNTGDKKRDDHLRGPDFFNTKEFPAISMVSKSIKKKGADKLEVTADLSMHGVTKPITFTLKRNKVGKDPWGNTRAGFETSFKVKRTVYGMSFMSKPGEVGDEIEMMIGIEGTKQ